MKHGHFGVTDRHLSLQKMCLFLHKKVIFLIKTFEKTQYFGVVLVANWWQIILKFLFCHSCLYLCALGCYWLCVANVTDFF